ncbi:helix-turn-helix domain-containing protein [Vibrio splendidus]
MKYIIVEALLIHTRGNQALAARMLGVNRGTLRKIYKQGFKDGS